MKITVSLQDKIRMKPHKNVKSYKLSEIFHESFSMKKFPHEEIPPYVNFSGQMIMVNQAF